MNWHFLWHDIQHGLLHLDKGIFFTVKEMFTRPGYAVKEFLEGKRVRHFRPISFVLVLAGICGFLFHYFQINILADKIQIDGSGAQADALKRTLDRANEWVTSHYAFVALLEVPIFSIGTWFAFRKAGYNYIEHIVLNAYLSGLRLIMQIIIFPVYIYLTDIELLKTISKTLDLIWLVMLMWAFRQFFKPMKKKEIYSRGVLSFVISAVILSAILIGSIFLGAKL